MPSQLLEKLRPFFDQGVGPQGDETHSTHPLDRVMRVKDTPRTDVLPNPPTTNADPTKPGKPQLNTKAHWKGGGSAFGNEMTKNTSATTGINNVSGVNTISIHETTGWPGYQGVDHMVARFLCTQAQAQWGPTKSNPTPHWRVEEPSSQGEGPQYYVDANGTVFALIGEYDLSAEPRATIHTESVNLTSIGIENGDVGDADIGPTKNSSTTPPYWYRMSTPGNPDTGDMPGLVCFALLHPNGDDPDLNLIWFSTAAQGKAIPDYPGSGDTSNIATRWKSWANMIFTERDYRSLALLVRLLFEKYGVPRNFCILPYSKQDSDQNTRDILRKIILADERQEMMARKSGMAVADIQNRTNAWTSSDNSALWFRFFGARAGFPSYRGVIAHAFLGQHACPGPLFDWHRFSREVWDWWWYPFDLNISVPALFAPRRGYMSARGDTSLREYYYDAAEPGTDFTTIGARINALAATTLNSQPSNNHFALDAGTPVYAMANGVVVAARLQNPANAANPPFVLIRHEIFDRADATTHAIDYDLAPTIVWTLTTYIDCHAFNYTQTSNDNPDWLNRMLIRLKECELAVAFKAAHSGADTLSKHFQKAWNYAQTISTGQRPTTGTGIQADADEYRRIINALQTVNAQQPDSAVLFPLESIPNNVTPVRTILGDFLGPCGTLSNGTTGSQMQIFSLEQLTIPDSTHVPLAWITQQWWKDASASLRLDGGDTKSLPAEGLVYSYPVTGFLDWLNQTTWSSEWRKYEVVDAAGHPVAAPTRPKTRLGI